MQRRIRAAFEAMTARASRLRIFVVRQSLPSKPNSRWAGETHNVRHSKNGRLLHQASMSKPQTARNKFCVGTIASDLAPALRSK